MTGMANGRRAATTHNFTIPVAMRLGDTPVPIPNTTVKPEAADGTMLETAWESRWLPDYIQKITGILPVIRD